MIARRRLLAFLALAVAAARVDAVEPAKLVPAQSEITFQLKQSGVPVEGRFKRFDAQLTLDPKAPQTGAVTVTIDTASATVGFAESDAELPGALWFDAKKYPRAVFQSSAITGAGGARFEAKGKFELTGTARGLVVPVTIVRPARFDATGGHSQAARLQDRDKERRPRSSPTTSASASLVFTGVGPF